MGDTIAVYPLFSKKANQEAIENMNPRSTKAMWITPDNAGGVAYNLNLDSVATVYTATKV